MRRPMRPIVLPPLSLLRWLPPAALFLVVLVNTAFACPAVSRSASNQRRQAETLAAHSAYIEAIPHYRAALAIDRAHSPLDACMDLNGLAEAYAFAGDDRTALRDARQARVLESRLSTRMPQILLVQARTLRLMGEIADDINQSDTAKALDQKALTFVPNGANSERGWILADLGDLAGNDDDTAAADRDDQQALAGNDDDTAAADRDDQQALAVAKRARDTRLIASVQARIGNNLIGERKYEDAVSHLDSARRLAQACGDRQVEDHVLGDLCLALIYLKRYDEALAATNQGLRIGRVIQDLRGEKTLLHNQGYAYFRQSNYAAARESYTKMLHIAIRVHDEQDQCAVLGDLGSVAMRVSDFGTAVENYRKAVRIAERLGDKDDQGTNLALLCSAYVEVGQYTPALISGYLAQSIFRRNGDDRDAAICWGNLGRAYLKRTQYLEALNCYRTALALDRKIKDRREEGNILGKIGEADWLLKRYPEATAALTDAVTIAREKQDNDMEQWADYNLGNVALDRKQYAQAETLYSEALADGRRTGELRLQAYASSRLMIAARDQDRPDLAIWYGKVSINTFQTIRAGLRRLERRTQASFIGSKASIYRSLADILIAQGRIPEAEQVLGMLKEEEYFDFIGQRRDAASQGDARADFTPDEKTWLTQYDRLGETVEQAKLNVDKTSLSDVDRPTPAQQAAYDAAKAKLDSADAAFEGLLKNLVTRFTPAHHDVGTAIVTGIQNNQANSDVLDRLESNTNLKVVELYTVEADSQYDVILQTHDISRWGAYPISAKDLNAKIAQFRAAIQDPEVDPRSLGEDLYKILVGPVETELDGYKPDVVMWSLDGPLGLVPVAALWDGKQYLVQRWQNTLFNAAAAGGLGAPAASRGDWKNAIGFGVSKSRTIGSDYFPELPGVPLELDTVIHDAQHADSASGVLPGRFYLDGEFTADDAIRRLAGGTHPVVHIASHFKLSAAGATASYLLAGSGTTITLEQIQKEHGLFAHVDLLTLSACSTAVPTLGAGADRNSVDSLDRLAEIDGARSVIAALWAVSDESTALLMEQFYETLKSDPAMTKAGALRAAQMSLLTGTASPSKAIQVALLAGRRRSVIMDSASQKSDLHLPDYKQDASKPFAHPYYWAPFALLGNWQ